MTANMKVIRKEETNSEDIKESREERTKTDKYGLIRKN